MPQLQSPGVATYVINKSQYVPAASGFATAIFTTATMGPVETPTLITSKGELHTVFGPPDYSKKTYGLYAAEDILDQTDQVIIIRVEDSAGDLDGVTAGIIAVEDGTGTAKQLFVATAKGEGNWVNDSELIVTGFNTVYNSNKGIWVTTTAYDLGDVVTAVTPDGLSYKCVIAGTSGGTEPTWPALGDPPLSDGTVSWTAVAPVSTVSFTISLNGTDIDESFNQVDVAEIPALTSEYFNFTAGTGVIPWMPPTLPTIFTTLSTGSTLGVDNVNEVTNPYVDAAVVAGWISTAIGNGVMDDAEIWPAGTMIAPGYSNGSTAETRQVMQDIVALAENRGGTFIINGTSQSLTPAGAVTERAQPGVPQSESASNPYYPWLKKYDTTLRQEIELPPEGFAAAVYHYNDRVGELWTPPAGLERGIVRGAIGLGANAKTDKGSQDLLFPAGINPIVYDKSARVIYMNAQKSLTMQPSKLDRIHVARLILTVSKALQKYADTFRFRLNDAETWNDIAGGARAYLADIQARRGFEDFTVLCDETTNTPVRRDRNELWMNVGVVPTGAAEFIYIPITVHRSGDLAGSAASA